MKRKEKVSIFQLDQERLEKQTVCNIISFCCPTVKPSVINYDYNPTFITYNNQFII